jgi:4-hydroxymandelate oxidase
VLVGAEPRVDLQALEREARGRLESEVYDFVAGGTGQERTVAWNDQAWARLAVRPRVLCDVSEVLTATTVLGTEVRAPVLVAPMGVVGMLHAEGELALRRGAASAGSLLVVSTRTSVPIPEIGTAADGPWWFQVYVLKDRGLTRELVRRAVEAGARALVLTGDTPLVAYKPRLAQHRLEIPDELFMPGLSRPDGGAIGDYPGAEQDPALTFDDIGWLADLAGGVPVVVKGVLRADDAERCVEAGAEAIVVSNHGGRQLDGAVPTAQALPEVVEAVGGRCEVYVDGGIRSGVDVLRALALGARAALVGRPAAWALAVGGSDGVRRLFESLELEVAEALALVGARRPEDAGPDLVRPFLAD